MFYIRSEIRTESKEAQNPPITPIRLHGDTHKKAMKHAGSLFSSSNDEFQFIQRRYKKFRQH